jgi:hypothetical protein
LCLPALVGLVVLMAACGGEGASVFQSAPTTGAESPTSAITQPATSTSALEGTATPATPPTTASSSTLADGDGSPTTEAPPTIDEELIRSVPAAQLPDGSDVLLGGAPNETAAVALLAELEATGIDLSGLEIWVWPVSGTDDVLLVLEANENASDLADNPDATDVLLPVLVGSSVLDTTGVTRIVINYRGVDEEGPYTFTATYPLDVVRASLEAGTEIPQDEVEFQLRRGV